MSQNTAYLAKLFGLFLVILSISTLIQGENAIFLWIALVHNAALVYVVGLVAIAAGLAIVLAHNVWSGGALPIVVTLLGWITLLKGIFVLLLPRDLAMDAFVAFQYDRFLYLYLVIWLVLGVYLTIAGFRTVQDKRG
jgi:hypothetical protein